MLLHQINFDNKTQLFCGPHAIAAATGLSPQDIVDLIVAQRILGRSGIKEPTTARRYAQLDHVYIMRFEEIAAILQAIGYEVRYFKFPAKLKVREFIEGISKNPQPGPIICRIAGHFFALSGCGRQISDTVSIQPEATEAGRYHGVKITHALTILRRGG